MSKTTQNRPVTESALRAEIRRKDQRMGDLEAENRALKHASNRTAIVTLYKTYPPLENLYTQLSWAALAADPTRSSTSDSDQITTSRQTPEPGSHVRHHQQRLRRINRQLENLSRRIADDLDDINTRTPDPRPTCTNPKCPKKGRRLHPAAHYCDHCAQPATTPETNEEPS